MPVALPCEAIEKAQRLSLRYDGHNRLVEVHAVGWTKAGHSVMRVWQVSGGSNSGETSGWKLMRLDSASGLTLTDQQSEAPRPQYARGDRAMQRIAAQV